MYHSLNNNSSKPQMCSSLFSNYYNDNFQFETTQEHYHTPSSFLVPSPIYIPLEDEAVFSEFFQQEPFLFNDHNRSILTHEMTSNVMGECCNNNGQNATNHRDDDHDDMETVNDTPKKIPSNRLRHSKINTARGLRDRRIRLSLDVAKKLFGLQDLLGFDKASKTIDWLLNKSKTAILDLLPDRSFNFTSESNGVSSTSDQCNAESTKNTAIKSSCGSGSNIKARDRIIGVRKCDPDLAKETRVRARQRARKRTIDKQNKYKDVSGDHQNSTFLDDHDDGSWSMFEENQLLIIDQTNSNFQFCQRYFSDR